MLNVNEQSLDYRENLNKLQIDCQKIKGQSYNKNWLRRIY